MISLYRHDSGILTHVPAGIKVVSFLGITVVLSLAPMPWWGFPACLAGALLASPLLGLPVPWTLRTLWQTKWIVLFLAGSLLLFSTPLAALNGTARVLLLVYLAAVLTVTTTQTDLLAVLERALRLLRPFGVNPARAALVLSLTIAVVPVIADLGRQVRDAQRARGLRTSWRLVLPLLVLTLRHADDMADALTARGID